ncbi:hypothetical protein C2845_PM11G10960 [Panicum miliaceum]|uniref:Uncharacterized protein n=1 Tax=Panicum miliaceum TaxID=4540 RepID=A0A3L6RRB7_PANMI|nr:hypothetical protein C2845_PM11G10960 [Panicum miliaceum]
MARFMAAISFSGLLSLIPLRKVLVIDYKLTYLSGTATAILINGFHSKQGDKNAKMQVRGFLKYFRLSFVWSFFQWFYTGGDVCGFVQFPTFGLKAWKQTFFFDFSLMYVGAGMICSHLVNISTLLGAILSWGILWPLISKQKGEWYPANVPESSMKSLYGYKAFLCIALIMGDGLYHFFKVLGVTVRSLHQRLNRKRASNRVAANGDEMVPLDDMQRDDVFNEGSFPAWAAYSGYAGLSVIAVITIPIMFRQIKWYYVIVAYVLAPLLGFANSYGTGLTDINMAYNYGKIALFIFAAWAGKENGVIAGLAGGTLVKQLVMASADLTARLQDGPPDHDVAEVPARGAVHRDGHGLHRRAPHVPALLQRLRHREPERLLEGPLRADLPEHGDPRRGGLLRAAQALPDALRGVLRVRVRPQRREGCPAAQVREAGDPPDGDGGAVPCGRELRDRHVRRELDRLCLGEDEQEGGGVHGPCGGLWFDLWRWHMDVPVLPPRPCQDQATNLHEVHT